MLLSLDAREYAHWTFNSLPTSPFPTNSPEVFLNGSWHALEWVGAPGTTRVARILVAGPQADNTDQLAVVLARGRYRPKLRLRDIPEVVIRQGGELNVV